MKVRILPVTPLAQNCSILSCVATRAAAVIDPGGDVERIIEEVEGQGLVPAKIFLTHGHLDHCSGAPELARHWKVPIEGPQVEDRFWIEKLPQACRDYGFPVVEAFEPARWLVAGDRVRFGAQELEVLHCPGHTPGHVVFFHRALHVAFVGDVLFAGSIGRTDFPRGNHADLIASIRGKLWPLGDDVSFVPGHGPLSSFGAERDSNPFVGDRALRS